jgi:hypothetical protein
MVGSRINVALPTGGVLPNGGPAQPPSAQVFKNLPMTAQIVPIRRKIQIIVKIDIVP